MSEVRQQILLSVDTLGLTAMKVISVENDVSQSLTRLNHSDAL